MKKVKVYEVNRPCLDTSSLEVPEGNNSVPTTPETPVLPASNSQNIFAESDSD